MIWLANSKYFFLPKHNASSPSRELAWRRIGGGGANIISSRLLQFFTERLISCNRCSSVSLITQQDKRCQNLSLFYFFVHQNNFVWISFCHLFFFNNPKDKFVLYFYFVNSSTQICVNSSTPKQLLVFNSLKRSSLENLNGIGTLPQFNVIFVE